MSQPPVKRKADIVYANDPVQRAPKHPRNESSPGMTSQYTQNQYPIEYPSSASSPPLSSFMSKYFKPPPPGGKSLRWIYTEKTKNADGKEGEIWKMDPDAVEWIKTINIEFCVAAVVGKFRTGKTVINNMVLLQARNGSGHQASSSSISCTKGINIFNKLIECVDDYGNKKYMLDLDTEGLGSTDAPPQHHMNTFALTFLLSTYMLFNVVGAIGEDTIESMDVVSKVASMIEKAKISSSSSSSSSMNDNDSDDSQSPVEVDRPTFHMLIRDSALTLDSEITGLPQTPNEHMEEKLMSNQNFGDEKNKIREDIKYTFPVRKCTPLVRPVIEEEDLAKLDTLEDHKVRKQFLDQILELRRDVFNSMQPYKVCGRPITSGEMYVRVAQSYIDAINNGAVMEIRQQSSMLSELQCRNSRDAAIQSWENDIAKDQESIYKQAPDDMDDELEQIRKKTIKFYQDKAFGSFLKSELDKLNDHMDKMEDTVREKNATHVIGTIKDQLEKVADSICDMDTLDDIRTLVNKYTNIILTKLGDSKNLRKIINDSVYERIWDYMKLFYERMETKQSALQNDINEINKKMQEALNSSESVRLAHTKMLNDKTLELDEVQRQLTLAQQQINSAKEEYEASFELKMKIKTQEVEDIQKKLDESVKSLEACQEEMLSNFQIKLDESADRERKLDEAVASIANYEKEKKSLQEDLDASRSEANMYHTQSLQVDNLKTRLASLEESKNSLLKDLHRAKEESSLMHSKFSQKMATAQIESRSVIEDMHKAHQQEKSNYTKQLSEQKIMNMEMEGKNVALEQKLNSVQRTLQEQLLAEQSQVSNQQKEIDSLRTECNRLFEQRKSLHAEYDKMMEDQRTKMTEESEKLRSEKKELTVKIMKEQMDNKSMVAELKTKLEHTDLRLKDYMNLAQGSNKDTEIRSLRMDYEKCNRDNERLQQQLGFAESDAKRLKELEKYHNERLKEMEHALRESELKHRQEISDTENRLNRQHYISMQNMITSDSNNMNIAGTNLNKKK